jgi:integrase/recombinase XerD
MDCHAATRDCAASPQQPAYECHECTHTLRHNYVTTMLDAGVSLLDVQIAARHADPKTTMSYDRAR